MNRRRPIICEFSCFLKGSADLTQMSDLFHLFIFGIFPLLCRRDGVSRIKSLTDKRLHLRAFWERVNIWTSAHESVNGFRIR